MRKTFVALAAAAFLVPAAAFAHHGWSSYDAEKALKVTGPLTELTWGNPHGMAKINYQGKSWNVVLAPTTRMEGRGLTKEMITPGKPVTLEGYPKRDGGAEMRIERIIVDGKTIELR